VRVLAGLVLFAASAAVAASPVGFREHLAASDLKSGYQVTVVDLDRDGDLDLIALASGMSELVWFENPGWKRHVLSTGRSRMINLAACGEDEEGFPVIVLAEGFSNVASKSPGTILVLERQAETTEVWRAAEIDRLPTSHRLRCADFDGSGRSVYVNAPLTGAGAVAPDYREPVPLVYYRPGIWKRELIGDENQGVMHGIHIFDWNGDGRDDVLTASFSGIHVYSLDRAGEWSRAGIANGDPSPWPKSGASDVTVGQTEGARFIAAIEPWHGNQVAVYTKEDGNWRRNVIEDSFVNGHTVAAADLNGDGRDEIIAGYRGPGQSVFIYYASSPRARTWTRHDLDRGGMSAASCAVAQLIGDPRPDIVCIGSATANLKVYENLGLAAPK